VGGHPGGQERPQGRDGEQRLEPGVCRRIVQVPAEVAQPVHDRAARFQLTWVHDHRGQAVLCGRASGGDQAAERPSDGHNPAGIDVRELAQRTFLLTTKGRHRGGATRGRQNRRMG
jgi:hypothetical protein